MGGGGVGTPCPHSGFAHVIAVAGSKGQDKPARIGYIHHLARAIAACTQIGVLERLDSCKCMSGIALDGFLELWPL